MWLGDQADRGWRTVADPKVRYSRYSLGIKIRNPGCFEDDLDLENYYHRSTIEI